MDTKRLPKNNMLYRTAILVSVFFIGWSTASAATLQINSPSTTLSPGDTTTLDFVINTEGVAINSAEAQIAFTADLIEVLSVSKIGSVFSLWVEDPSFSNSTGIITFNGGVPTPGYIGSQGLIVSVVVRAKKVGQAVFIPSNTAVRANDGLGTNVLNSQQGKVITIVKREEPIDIISALPNLALKITSLTHPNQDQWYKDRNPVFQWIVPAGSDAIQTTIDNNPTGVPHVTYSPAISEKVVKDLEDGIWYFKVRARQNGVLGPISVYIARIDATPPEKKNVAFTYDDNAKILRITAEIQDITSGVDHYELSVDDVLVKNISAKEFINGSYVFAFDAPGDHTVKLLAVDHAGNSVESLGTFRATGTIAPELESVPSIVCNDGGQQLITIGSFIIPMLHFIIIIILIVILLILAAFYSGRQYGRSQSGFKMRTALVKGDDSKMLLVLRRHLEKHLGILQHIRHGRILTGEEKEIKKALENDLDEVDKIIEGRRENGESGT